MKSIDDLLQKNRNGTVVAVFPHADDFAFVSGGLFQRLQKYEINTRLLILADEVVTSEVKQSGKILGLDDFSTLGFKKGSLSEKKQVWLEDLKKEILEENPFAIITFDPYGVTGNKDHTDVSSVIFDFFKSKRPRGISLLWRMADVNERKYFKTPKQPFSPSHFCRLSVFESFRKIKAITSFKSKFKSFLFKLRIIEFYLFDYNEYYYKVDLGRDRLRIVYS